MLSLGWIWSAVVGSFWGRMMAIAVASLAALGINNVYQRHQGAKQERARIVTTSNKVAKSRDEAIRKNRNRRNPSDASRRLLNDYARTD